MCYRLSPNVNSAGSRFMQCQCQCHWWHWHDLGHCVLAMFRIFQVKMNTNISPGAVESSTHLWRATWLWIPVSGRGSSALLVAFGVDVWNLASVKVSRWRDCRWSQSRIQQRHLRRQLLHRSKSLKWSVFDDALGGDTEITLYIIINDLGRSKPHLPSWPHHGTAPLIDYLGGDGNQQVCFQLQLRIVNPYWHNLFFFFP